VSIPVRFKLFKDPVSWATHFAGFLASIVGLVFLVVSSAHDGVKVTAMAIYGGSLVVLFGASSIYHFLDLGWRGNRWLQRLDHCAIFLLIAGSYVPVAVHLLDGAWRLTVLAVVGVLAACGIVLKILWIDCPDGLSTGLYMGLAWLAVIPAYHFLPQMDLLPVLLLLSGGLAYSVGAAVYLWEWPDPWPKVMGHHEIWHLFVLVGATSHFFVMWDLVDRSVPAF